MTLPVSLAGRYQLLVLGSGPGLAGLASRLDTALARAFAHLGVNAGKFLARLGPSLAGAKLDRRLPSVAVFFGMAAPLLSGAELQCLDDLITDGSLIIPVVAETTSYTSLVPPQLAMLNGVGIQSCGEAFERLAARVLEGFGLLRERRRLFISYRRLETSGVATQLYEALDSAGFDVFLDTHGVLRPGEPFQEILWHRLADTDVALLLDSPGFLASRWTEEELARANNSSIQILQVLWPDQTEPAAAAFSTFHPLTDADFDSGAVLGPTARLRDTSVSGIVDEVEGLRARAMAARQAFLVREFLQEARRAGLQVRTTLERVLIVSAPDGNHLVQPVIGIPDAERYEYLEELHRLEVSRGRTYRTPPILLYDQKGLHSRWLGHLAWLNGSLSCANSLSLDKAESWLTGLARSSAV